MAAAHLESTGNRLFIRTDSLAGTGMTFTGDGSNREFDGFDGGALEELAGWSLLRVSYGSRGSESYRVTGEGQLFFRWLKESRGSAPAQVEDEVQKVVNSAQFALSCPGAARHLSEAFGLLWSGETNDQVVSEIGDHLRKALMDATSEVLGDEARGSQEKPIDRLERHLEDLQLPSRESGVLIQLAELARSVLSLDHRLNHIRDEADTGRAEVSWEEVRRAAFTTAFVCYELDRLQVRRPT